VEDTDEARAAVRTERSFDRFVNFSDAVFAIAITLLVLDVRMPVIDSTMLKPPPLAHQLPGLLPNLFAFSLSFVVIGGYWVAHHRLFKFIDRADTRLVWINLFVLFCVVLLPLPTQIVADYGNTTLGVLIYAGAMVVTGLSIIALSVYAHKAGLTSRDADFRLSMIKSSITPGVFAASMVVSLWSPYWATKMWWLVALAYFVVDPLINSDWSRLGGKKGGAA
jgi:uncharacterized membrane protein